MSSATWEKLNQKVISIDSDSTMRNSKQKTNMGLVKNLCKILFWLFVGGILIDVFFNYGDYTTKLLWRLSGILAL